MHPLLIKLAVSLAMKPDNLKKILITLGVVVLIIAFFPAIMFMTISALLGNGLINDQFDITQTELFKQVNPVYEDYVAEVKSEMEAEANRIIEANTTTDIDPDTLEETSECSVSVTVTVNQPGLCKLLAYITAMDEEVKGGKSYKLKRSKILEFYKNIDKVEITNNGDDYLIQNISLSPEATADLYFQTKEDKDFYLTSYQNYLTFYEENTQINVPPQQTSTTYNGKLTYGANGMNIPLFKQGGGQPWSSVPYGNGTIASSGCAPTSLSMVITYLTGKTVTPANVVSWTGNRYYISGQGSTWGIFAACAAHWGISCRNLGKDTQSILTSLSQGKPVIASMGPGTFTKGGHLIVLRGVTEDGKILVNDPSDNDKKDHVNRKFNLELIMRESKNFWSFD
jgi:hypothetical protein